MESQAFKKVKEINDKLGKYQCIDFWIDLSYISDGDNEAIEYLGNRLWDNINYSEQDLDCIEQHISKINKCIGKIKL